MSPEETRPAETPVILMIDDDTAMLSSVGRMIRTEDIGQPLPCSDPREAEALLAAHPVSVILLDLTMPHLSGQDLLRTLRIRHPGLPVVVVTATTDVDTAVACVKAGAFDYLVKPVDFSRLIATLIRALTQRDLWAENRRLRALIQDPKLRQPACFASIITQAPEMTTMFRYIEGIAPSMEPVLILGETGSGKELVARALHGASGRTGPLVAVNVAAIDTTAFTDTLFGHVKGAFTGADKDRRGMIDLAGEGTLFLDEIGDLDLDAQTKLLRLLEEREFIPLGSDRCQRSRCRILAATNRDLRTRMGEGRFREDLYYRLGAHLVRVPPLRERPGDIPLLIDHFLREAAQALGKPVPTPTKELAVYLKAYEFPGNVRELRAMVMDAVARHTGGILSLEAFHKHMDEGTSNQPRAIVKSDPDGEPAPLFAGRPLPTVETAINALIAEALQRTDGNQGAAARLLGISRRTISRYVAASAANPSTPT